MELLEFININNHAINLIKKTLKTYIETNLTNISIRSFKLIAKVPIFIFLEVMNFGLSGLYQTLCFTQLYLIDTYHEKKIYKGNNLKIVF